MPTSNLKVALIPLDMKLGDADYNLSQIKEMVGRTDLDTDIVVLPEMCTTGYTVDPQLLERFIEPTSGRSISFLKELSKDRHVALCGTFACSDSGHNYNRGFFIDPDTERITYYDKRHLFTAGRENMLYTRGMAESPIIGFRGWNIKMSICYDLRVQVWNRNISCGYDLLIIPANWPEARSYAWKQLLIARAIENQAYIAGCNRLGEDPYGSYNHDISHIFDHRGYDITEKENGRGLICATLDGGKLDRDRLRFAPWRDQDDFSLFVD